MKTAKPEVPVKTEVPVMTEVKVRAIPVEQLFVSLEENRKTIDQVALAEMAKSIEKDGVIEALLVRPRDLDQPDGAEWYEIVAGQRRWLASKLAGKKTCPCIVRAMTDDEAREICIVSNLQREDLPPMEEAEAYGKLLVRPGATIETVAAALAKSPSYVGRRLKLLDAVGPVREALRLGAIETGHALELTRLSERQQQELLEWLDVGYRAPQDDDEDGEDDADNAVVNESEPGTCSCCGATEEDFAVEGGYGWANPERTVCSDQDCVVEALADGLIKGMIPTRKTVAELRNRIVRTELRVLRDVPFPLEAEIAPMACTECPKRAAGAASLFADIAEDTCTDPACLANKLQLWVKFQLEAAEREGRKLAMLYDGHASERAGVSRFNCTIGAECEGAESAVWVSGARIGHCVQICRDEECSEHGAGAMASGSTGETTGETASGTKGGIAKPATAKQSAEEKRKAEAQKAEGAKLTAQVTQEREYRKKLFAAIAQVPEAQIDAPRIALLTRLACLEQLVNNAAFREELASALACDASLFDYGSNEKLEAFARGLTLAGALRAAALATVVSETSVGGYTVQRGIAPARLEQVAAWLGIDAKSIRSGKPAPVASSKATPPARAKPTAATAKKTVKAAPEKPASKKTAQKAVKKAVKKAVGKAAKKTAAKPVTKKAAKKGGGR